MPAIAGPTKSLIKKSGAENARAYLRMKASLETGKDICWWYEAAIYGLADGEHHRSLCKLDGFEAYHVTKEGDGYRLHGTLVSYFRDFETGAFNFETEAGNLTAESRNIRNAAAIQRSDADLILNQAGFTRFSGETEATARQGPSI